MNNAFSSDRKHVLDAAREYYHRRAKPEFVPGETLIPAATKVVDEDDLAFLIDASLDLWLTAGRYAHEFEKELPKWFGRNNPALLVNSGSSANLLAISSMGSQMVSALGFMPLERGDEVITAAAGFPTTVSPIYQNGWKPVFVDVDLRTLNVMPETVMSAKTQRTRAVVLAHTLGNPYRSDLLSEWCKQEGLFLIEDCCDALGAKINGKPVGSFGHFATTSFYPAHHITMGEGGAVISQNPRFRRIAESIRDWGRDCWCEPGKDNTCGKRFDWKLGDLPQGYDHKYTYSNLGYNLKATDMQAAIGVSQLRKLDRFVQARQQNWKVLSEGIQNSTLLREHLIVATATDETEPSWFGFTLICRESLSREKLTRYLENHKMGTRLVFGGNLTKQPAYRSLDFSIHQDLKNTDTIMNSAFWIAVHPALTSRHLQYMIDTLEEGVSQSL